MSQNKVELIGYYGSDETHALSAWTSTSRDLTDERHTRIPAMLLMLAQNGHHTPFEKSLLHFLVTCDTASHIHIIKHRIGVSVNVESARYKELKEDRLYIPTDWSRDEQLAYLTWCEDTQRQYHAALARLTPIIGRKRAKESARFYLPYGSQITMDVSFNWRSFSHFLGLRNSQHAQLEIREIAGSMLRLVEEIPTTPFKFTITAFRATGLLGDVITTQ